MRQNLSKHGFSLIELLIVMAILGILSSTLIPNLLSARRAAYNAATQAFLKEVALVQEIYYTDQGQYFSRLSQLRAVDPAAFQALNKKRRNINFQLRIRSDGTDSYCVSARHRKLKNAWIKLTNKGSGYENGRCTNRDL